MIIGPCKECDRQGCGKYHEICPEYKKYKAEIETERSNRIKECKKETHYKYGQFKNHKNKFIKCHKK